MKECPDCKRCFPDHINHCPHDGDATTRSLPGEPILDSRYLLEKRLGQGGMGVVYQARHIFLKTSHAIKVILPDLVGNDPMLVTRFRQEALAAAAIRHQNIIAVTDYGVVHGTMPFLVMELVEGKSLQDILTDEKRMSPERALEFISAIGAGLGAAHRQNIVHRDLKPLNIIVKADVPITGGAKILDFGLARIKSDELLGSFVQAETSGLMGSPFYMAPEQWSDEEPDSRADVYSLGIILYQMLSGDVPFKGSSIPSIMKKHLTLPPPSFKSVGVDVPPRVEAVVFHALEKEVEARTSTVEEFLTELRAAVEADGVTMQAGRETIGGDFGTTLFEPSPSIDTAPQHLRDVPARSTAGQISSPMLSPAEQEKLAASRAQHEFEQQERDRIAREELEREAAARRQAAQGAERKRKEEEERVNREKAEREERERQQREQIERVERQARELEERLAKLSTSMPPSAPKMTLGREPAVNKLARGEDGRAWVQVPKSAGVTLSFSERSGVSVIGASVQAIKGWIKTPRGRATAVDKTPVYLDENVQFTVYKPRTIRPEKWYPLLAYAHLSERRPGQNEPDPIEQMQREAKSILGAQAIKNYRRATEDSAQAVPRRGKITFVPFVAGVEFDPPSRSCFWLKSVHGQEFRMRASANLGGTTPRGQMSVFLGSILLAEINISLQVDSGQVGVEAPVVLEKEQPARPYRKIFPSYSHRDREIVTQIAHYAEVTGDKYMLDITELRSGQNWKKWMREKVEEADIFQLFWSTNSMRSQNVKLEWQHALYLGRTDFIRPTYWETPLPQSIDENLPPPELLDLHFQQVRPPRSFRFLSWNSIILIAFGVLALLAGLIVVLFVIAK